MITEVVDLHGSGETWGHIHTIHIHTIHLQGSTLALQRRDGRGLCFTSLKDNHWKKMWQA